MYTNDGFTAKITDKVLNKRPQNTLKAQTRLYYTMPAPYNIMYNDRKIIMAKETNKKEKEIKQPSALLSILPVVLLVAMLVQTVQAFGSNSLDGASQVTLLTVSAFCVFVGMVFLHVPWKNYEDAITKSIASVASPLLILLMIGALSGAWMTSGVVPTLIYYGMKIISPQVFLASTCAICALVSVMTGSSWTTVATIGIALMGIGRAQGFSEGWIAGAIISGAYFGDKISPLSDTTVLASGCAEVQLFDHIKYMLITTVPSITITLIAFAVAGFVTTTSGVQDTEAFTTALEARFNITPWLLVVPLCSSLMIMKRMPPLITLFLSSMLAIVFGCIFQREALNEINPDLFQAAMKCLYDSTALSTDNALLSDLVQTNGMAGMMGTIWLIICAMCFGGAMTAGGFIAGITRIFTSFIKGRTSMVWAHATTGVMINVAIADQYLCILLSANMFRDIYDKGHFERRLLSRTTEDSVTVTSVLVPWNTCGMTQSTVLGVSTFTYLPYCFFNIISPLMSIFVAALGYKIFKVGSEENKI